MPSVLRDMPFALIGRSGLPPDEDDLSWIETLMSGRSVFFVGDMDPADIMIFVWLRERLQLHSFQLLGVSDLFLSATKVDPNEDPESILISCSPREQRAVEIFDELELDLSHVVGKRCADTLRRREKFELEAVLYRLRRRPEDLIATIVT
jgi:hypothetical protein